MWLEGVAAVVQRHRTKKYAPRLLQQGNGERAEDTDLPVFATAIHHRIIVEPSETHYAPHVFSTALPGEANDYGNRERVVLDLLSNLRWATSSG